MKIIKIYYLIACFIVNNIHETLSLRQPGDYVKNVVSGSSGGEAAIEAAATATASVLTNTAALMEDAAENTNDEKVQVTLKRNLNSVFIKNTNNNNNNETLKISSDLNVSEILNSACPSLQNADLLTQTELIKRLTAACRYDRLERPPVLQNDRVGKSAVKVFVRFYIYVVQNLESSDLQFKIHGLLQMRYNDPRLQFAKYAANRKQPIMGESLLRNVIWVPHIFLANEHNSNVLGTNEEDILTAIHPDGTVIVSTRVQATLYCWMKLQKFPFDEQFCPIVFESWMYNSSEVVLYWEQNEPITFDPKMHLTEYALQKIWTNETLIMADINDLRHGAFASNYSSLSFTIHLTREVGYYVMDYFLPSIMIVAISWVSFWLQADQTPARTTLGCTTLLSFITLASSQEKNLPKVSYIKISEVWFLACTCFIFGSLMEFAFVNTIWRRRHSVEVKKIKSKYILKSTLTPNMKRHKMIDNNNNSNNNHSNNNPNNNYKQHSSSLQNGYERYLSIGEAPVFITINDEDLSSANKFKSNDTQTQTQTLSVNEDNIKAENTTTWATMTPHEVSLWIDRKARFIFPLTFIIFNAFFWTFVYCL